MKFEELLEHEKESLNSLLESSQFTKFRQYVFGLKPMGKGMVIATPQNPAGGADSEQMYQNMTPDEQDAFRKLNGNLYKWGEWLIQNKLRKRYFKQEGIFDGQRERSFVIVDMSREEAIELGRKWRQTAVIFIERDQRGYSFEMIQTGGTNRNFRPRTDSLVRKLFGSDADDYVSIIGGNKYVIPFYDDRYEWEAQFGPDAEPGRRKAGPNKGMPIYKNRVSGGFIAP